MQNDSCPVQLGPCPTRSFSTEDADKENISSDEIRDTAISEIARNISRSSTIGAADARTVFNPVPGSKLDPHSPSFNPTAWVKSFKALLEGQEDRVCPRRDAISFHNLSVSGHSVGTAYQNTTGNIFLTALSSLAMLFSNNRKKSKTEILREFDGIVSHGEMLLVLGPPGSGCSTLLKTLAGQTNGLNVSRESYLSYRGMPAKEMYHSFRDDILYNAELDVHLPHLTVGETLTFAARAKVGMHILGGFSPTQISNTIRDVVMAIFGIAHTKNTRVGDEYVRGVSGGERKRVSIAEAALTGARFQCWDNSTRGLDSRNAIHFCKTLRVQADYMDVASAVALYQAPQEAYELFDRVTVLYDGLQIFYGRVEMAKKYFEELGFECPERQTTPDFLTSMTSAQERRVKPGYEHKAPRSPEEFASRWRESEQRLSLLKEIEENKVGYGEVQHLKNQRKNSSTNSGTNHKYRSPYTLPYWRQTELCLWRGWRRLLADPEFTIAQLLFNFIVSLVLGSMFYNMRADTSSFYYRGGVIFFALLFNAFASQLEVLTLYAERPTVEKHNRYAFYRQSAQATASFLIDIPYKTVNMIIFNVIVYFMANLRREAGSFFFFCLTTYLTTLTMSSVYRTLACVTRTSHQAMVPSSILTLGVMIYTGFTIPTSYMPRWSRWMNYINPLAYAFESLMANEFHGRGFPCAKIVPSGPAYDDVAVDNWICASVGARPGSHVVDGDDYINISFGYWNSHKWRNVGILFAFLVGFFALYTISAECARPPESKGEVLVFRRRRMPRTPQSADLESRPKLQPLLEKAQGRTIIKDGADLGAVFHWEDLCYDIKIKGEDRRILDHVDGWVRPGTSTALMGSSGAGKTTLLDILASRVTVGVVSGDILVDGIRTDASFAHHIGYVQQQDLHLSTTTVREALEFSALLRQSASIPRQEKLAYVEEVIKTLEMDEFADAIVGISGEGLNVEQRKRLTIGVELAARPELLVFLDEPTSGLDSQTSWAICDLIEKLVKSGQAVLCTIHQPSAILFQRFDRLLLLQPGGKTVYFGDLGRNATILIDYLERYGAAKCSAEANPAEWMLSTIEQPPPNSGHTDWSEVWRSSPEYREMKRELEILRQRMHNRQPAIPAASTADHWQFAVPFSVQFWEVLKRVSRHFYRSPTYIYSKVVLVVLSALYVGFSFEAHNSIQGLQNQLYAFYMYLTLFGSLNEQIMPVFVPQRALYEVREQPSRMYQWSTYVLSNIIVEALWNTLVAVLMYFCWFYPVGFTQNMTVEDVHIRGFLVFLFLWMFMLFVSTFSHLVITAMETPDTAGTLAALIWILVGVSKVDLPGFWSFMYYLSPATYLVSGVMSTSLSGSKVTCATNELLHIRPLKNMTCGEYMSEFISHAGGYLLDSNATGQCEYCTLASTDEYLAGFNIDFKDRWRNFGLLWVYVAFNIFAALGVYYCFRASKCHKVKKGSRNTREKGN
ncbi:ABC-2 type transporter-domain-containing protein [Aspergillus alliaceus]|uniref:ABC-2 type transporter-domain-containing protein n=1 Tax=Petromyces alliaceus TaxID=209559 RepID=A0A5N7CJP1_PETAA|nr:ABC-2 type transporter-domain-containing protein [Aspergillus alliaceus]